MNVELPPRMPKYLPGQRALEYRQFMEERAANFSKAAPEMFEALTQAHDALLVLSENAGDVPEWNEGGKLYETIETVHAAIHLSVTGAKL